MRTLQERLEIVRGRNTRGGTGPALFLLSERDFAYMKDALTSNEDHVRACETYGYTLMTWRGIRVVKAPFVSDGEPMVAMAYEDPK